MSSYQKALALLLVVIAVGTAFLYVFMLSVVLNHIETELRSVPTRPHAQVCNLPCRCRPLLNLGTWEWAECMGVGKK